MNTSCIKSSLSVEGPTCYCYADEHQTFDTLYIIWLKSKFCRMHYVSKASCLQPLLHFEKTCAYYTKKNLELRCDCLVQMFGSSVKFPDQKQINSMSFMYSGFVT